MSGVKRRTKYRKNITQETYNGTPSLSDDQVIVQVKGSRGGNTFEVVYKKCIILFRLINQIQKYNLLFYQANSENLFGLREVTI